MAPSDLDRHIAMALAQVLKERLIELESSVAAGQVSDDMNRRLDFVRMLLRQFNVEAVETVELQPKENAGQKQRSNSDELQLPHERD